MPKRVIIPGLAARLKSLREKAGLTQQQAADATEMYQADIARYELEQRVPTLAQLYKLADAYGVNICELLPGGLMPKRRNRK